MSDDENILGTRVPDTPIHRASLWLEEVKFGAHRTDAKPVEVEDQYFEDFIRKCKARNLTREQMEEAAQYYGRNMLAMTMGRRVTFAIPSPTGEGMIDAAGVFISLWLDAFMHGYATAKGMSGRSNAEIARGDTRP